MQALRCGLSYFYTNILVHLKQLVALFTYKSAYHKSHGEISQVSNWDCPLSTTCSMTEETSMDLM